MSDFKVLLRRLEIDGVPFQNLVDCEELKSPKGETEITTQTGNGTVTRTVPNGNIKYEPFTFIYHTREGNAEDLLTKDWFEKNQKKTVTYIDLDADQIETGRREIPNVEMLDRTSVPYTGSGPVASNITCKVTQNPSIEI